jgi:23S rRNA (pseudouridine1915-N3)-methyltransferase
VRVTLAAVGRLGTGAERDLFERYRGRIDTAGKRIGIGPLQEAEIAESRRGSAGERRREEARLLLDRIPDGAVLVALDETGTALTSEAFARRLEKFRDGGARELAFALGGADGHGPPLLERATLTLALSPMTLPHGLARTVLAEQLYRSVMILSGHPYHRG